MRMALATAAVVALVVVPQAHAGAGAIDITAKQRLGPRLVDLTMTTPALAEPVHARILLPSGYRAHPKRRYPVLLLLHGGFGSYVDWTESGDAEAITKGEPLITVMPEDGNGGWYADWYNGGAGGPPRWETYDVRQLLPWVDKHSGRSARARVAPWPACRRAGLGRSASRRATRTCLRSRPASPGPSTSSATRSCRW